MRVSISLDFEVPPNWSIRFEQEPDHFSLFLILSGKHPFPVALGFEIFLRNPKSTLVRMSSFCPLPKHEPDRMINSSKGFLRDHMAMIVCPTPQNRIQHLDKVYLPDRFVCLDDFP